MDRPLIVHVVHRFAVGGLENGVVNLVNAMPESAWRHAVVALTEVDEAFRARIRRDDVTCIALHKPPGHGFRLYPAFYRLLRELRPSIVHTRNLAALEMAVPAWAAGVPVRIHGEHGRDLTDLGPPAAGTGSSDAPTGRSCDHFVALSHGLESYLRDQVGVPAARITHIYNGVDTDRFRPAPAGRAPIPGCPFAGPDLFLVGSVGRMEAVKDPFNLARAFLSALRATLRARDKLRLVMVGEGPSASRRSVSSATPGSPTTSGSPANGRTFPTILRGLDSSSCLRSPKASRTRSSKRWRRASPWSRPASVAMPT